MKGKWKASDWYTIPNLLGYFRILLIPVFAWLYLQAETSQECFTAALVIGLSGLTDLFDGKIARKFNQVTELGKFLDPVADKLTLGVIIVCLATRYREIWLLAGLFLIKEGFLKRTPRGREATPLAYEHLGFTRPRDGEASLF